MSAKKIAVVCALLTGAARVNGAAFGADDESVRFVTEGESFAASGDWRSAAGALARASQSGAWKQRALYDLGIAYYHLGEFQQSISVERAAIQLNPRFVSAYIQLATVLIRIGDNQAAVNALTKALQIDPQSKVARANLANIRANYVANRPAKKTESPIKPTQNHTDANAQQVAVKDVSVAVVQKLDVLPMTASSQNPANGANQNNVSKAEKLDILPILGCVAVKDELAHDVSVAVVQKLNTIPVTNTSLPKTPVTAVTGPLVALDNIGGQDFSLAAETVRSHELTHVAEPNQAGIDVAETVERQHAAPASGSPQHSTAVPTRTKVADDKVDISSYLGGLKIKANELVDKALKLFNDGSVDQAKYALKRAVNLDTSNVVAHIDFGVVLGTQGDFAGDAEQQRAAIDLDATNALANFNLGWALAQQKQWSESLRAYSGAAKLPESLAGKALAMSHLGKAPAAIQLLAAAKTRFTKRAWPCAGLAAVYMEQGLTDKAVDELKQGLRREPNDIESQKLLVQAGLSLKKWQFAVEQCKVAMSKTPYDVDAYLDMAHAQEQLKDNAQALSTLRIAMEVAPANAVTHAAMSNVLERLGHSSEAEDEARLALKLDPKQEIADSILQRLSTR